MYQPRPDPTPSAAQANTQGAAFGGTKGPSFTEIISKVASIVSADELGQGLHTSRTQALTESEAEYTMHAIKHVFANYIVVEFLCTNTLSDQVSLCVYVRVCVRRCI